MTIEVVNVESLQTGDGSTTVFNGPVAVRADDVSVYFSNGSAFIQLGDDDFEVSGVGTGQRVSVTIINPAYIPNFNDDGTYLSIISEAPNTQETSLPVTKMTVTSTIELSLDLLTILVQQLEAKTGRSIRTDSRDFSFNGTLPLRSARANRVLSFDANGNPITAISSIGSGSASVYQAGVLLEEVATRFDLGGNLIGTPLGNGRVGINDRGSILVSPADELDEESLGVTDLPAADTLTGANLVHAVQNDQSVQVPLSTLAQFIKVAETIVPASEPFKGALLRRTSNLDGVSFPLFVPWQEAAYDSDSFWSGGAATRITIPAGITKVRLTGSVRFNATQEAGTISCRIYKNGAIFPFSSSIIQRQGEIGWDDNANGAFTPVVPVVEGDFFELRANRSGLASMANLIQNVDALFFSVEVIERASAPVGSDPDRVQFLTSDTNQSFDASDAGNYCVWRTGVGWTAERTITFNGAPPSRGRLMISNNSGHTVLLANGTGSPLDLPFGIPDGEYAEMVVFPTTGKLIKVAKGGS